MEIFRARVVEEVDASLNAVTRAGDTCGDKHVREEMDGKGGNTLDAGLEAGVRVGHGLAGADDFGDQPHASCNVQAMKSTVLDGKYTLPFTRLSVPSFHSHYPDHSLVIYSISPPCPPRAHIITIPHAK